jgi:DNA polymerase-3 subunit delta'
VAGEANIDYRLAAGAPWLAGARERISSVLAADRLAHALLIQGQAGVGKAALADWIARLALCEHPAAGPCDACVSCHLHAAGTHPDLIRVGLVDEHKQIAVEDVRAMIGRLTLKSYRGGNKVAIVDPADAMNPSSANALLKTLEEPASGTLLVLTAARPERLPATITSRCQRLKLTTPDATTALAWLSAIDASIEWRGPLALASGAPVRALELAHGGAADLEAEMSTLPGLLARPDPDFVGLAERFQQQMPAERLRWIENWVTERIRKGVTAPAPGHSPSNQGLPQVARTRHIQGLYTILDEVRAAQVALRGQANVQLLWERLLVMLGRELTDVRAAVARESVG